MPNANCQMPNGRKAHLSFGIRHLAFGILLLSAVPGCNLPALDPLPPPADPRYTDEWITQHVLLRFEADLELRKFAILVQTEGSICISRGRCPASSCCQAEQLAAVAVCRLGPQQYHRGAWTRAVTA